MPLNEPVKVLTMEDLRREPGALGRWFGVGAIVVDEDGRVVASVPGPVAPVYSDIEELIGEMDALDWVDSNWLE